MLYVVNDFLGSGQANKITPVDPVIHRYNSNGHRSKQVEDLDIDNYILYLGCSHTEGVGLEPEEIYTHHVSKQLDMDYYNMGVGGSGCDVMFYNLMTWLFKYKHKPKLIVLQWSFPLRYARFHDDNDPTHIQTEGSWSSHAHIQFSILGERIGYFPLRNQLYLNVTKQLGIPIVHVSFPEYMNKILKNYIEVKELDKARDNQHLGPISHSDLATRIVSHIKDNNLLV